MIYLSLVQYVIHEFLTGICVVSSIRKIASFLKNLWLRCVHLFDKYKYKKAIVESLRGHNHTQGTTGNAHWAFSQKHSHPLIETSSRGSYNSQKFDLANLFYF